MNEPYNSVSASLKRRYGEKVRKIPLDAGFSCPNKDGRIAVGGCIFCDEYSAAPLHTCRRPLEEQIEHYLQRRPQGKFIAYFQANTNTADPAALPALFEVVSRHPRIVAVHLGTRPDCLSPEAVAVLRGWQKHIDVTIEIGLQSIHEKSLLFLQRHHTYACFLEAFARLRAASLPMVVHLIVGIPGETREDERATVAEMNRLRPEGVKFHLLHLLRGTRLLEVYRTAPFPLLSRAEYVERIVDLLERLHPDIVVHRLTAERERELFVAPEWALDKVGVIADIRRRLQEHGTRQGEFCTNC